MNRKLFRTGNSLVVSLPAEALRALGLGEGSEVAVTLDEAQGQIAIRPAAAALAGVDEAFARQVAAFIEAYRPALEALARQ